MVDWGPREVEKVVGDLNLMGLLKVGIQEEALLLAEGTTSHQKRIDRHLRTIQEHDRTR